MPSAPLDILVAAARALPGGSDGGDAPQQPRAAGRGALAEAQPLSLEELEARIGLLLRALSTKLQGALPSVLALASTAWDQVDALQLLDRALLEEAAMLRARAAELADDADAEPATRAGAVAVRLTVDSAYGLVSLVERRLASLIRLRLRAEDPDLLPSGKPFLDLGAALGQAATVWS